MSNAIENGGYSACLDAMLLSTGQVYPLVLNAAIELSLFEIIGQGDPKGMSPSDIASKLSNPQADSVRRLDRVLFLLASYSLLTFSSSNKVLPEGIVERLYALSPTGKCFLSSVDGDSDDDDGASYAAVSKLFCHPTFVKVWQNLKEVVFEKEEEEDLYSKVNGITVSEYMETDPAFKLLFQKAMSDLTTIQMRQIVETYTGFEGVSTLVDVSGGNEKSLKMIISKYPSIKGINFDLPELVQHTPSHPGITHVGGDIFEGVPEGDAIMIKSATPNKWTDEQWIQILKNCYGSLKEDGKVIVIDVIMPEIPGETDGDKYVAVLDVIILQAGGKQRTVHEFGNLAKCAGFSRSRVAASVFASALGVIELYK